MKNFEKARLA